MAEQETIFTNGIYFEKKAGSPSYVIGKMSFKVADVIEFLKQYENDKGYVNIDILEAKSSGKPYCKLNQYTLEKKENLNSNPVETAPDSVDDFSPIDYPEEDNNLEDIPF